MYMLIWTNVCLYRISCGSEESQPVWNSSHYAYFNYIR